MQDFNHKVAVITGAGSGVGRCLALDLAQLGAHVVVADIEACAIDNVVTEITGSGGSAIGQTCDVSKIESMQSLAEVALKRFGAIHLVFANAGIGAGEAGSMWEYPVNDWEWGFQVNTWGVINTISAFMPILMEQNIESNFVITGSGNGAFVMMPEAPIYTASKAAVQAITENLYFQVKAANSNVMVNALFPGPHVVNTGIFNSERNRPEDLPPQPGKADSGIHSVDDMKAMMEQFGMTLQTTEPSEVSAFALQGIRDNKFWITKMTDKSKAALELRMHSILAQENPNPPVVL